MESVQNFFQGLIEKTRTFAEENPRKAMIYVGLFLLLILSFFLPVDPPHVALSGEPILEGGWFTNSLLATIVIDIVLIVAAVMATRNMNIVPSGWQNVMEALIEYLYGLSESVAGKAGRSYFPWVVTVFLFVLVSNWSGLIPGAGSIGVYHTGEHAAEDDGHALLDRQLAMVDGKLLLVEAAAEEEGHAKFVPLWRAPSADLNMTFAYALATMFMVQVYGVRALGAKYFGKFFTLKGEGAMKGVNAFVGILELISEVSRVLTFAFRLFGNIFAGEVVLATMAFLVAFLIPLPFYFLELLVGAVQALVFMMLCLAFFSMATISHDEHH